ncbi:MAG TPA: hypothetical protein VF752_02245 [Thermoleophilaceae bacterium]
MAASRAAFCAAALASAVLIPAAPAVAKSERYSVTYARGLVQMSFQGNGTSGLVKHTIRSAKRRGAVLYDPSNGKGSGSFPVDARTVAESDSCTDNVKVRRERIDLLPRSNRREQIVFAPAPDRAHDVLATKCAAPGLSDLDAAQIPEVVVPRAPFTNDTLRLTMRFSAHFQAGAYSGRVQMRLRLVMRRSTRDASGR